MAKKNKSHKPASSHKSKSGKSHKSKSGKSHKSKSIKSHKSKSGKSDKKPSGKSNNSYDKSQKDDFVNEITINPFILKIINILLPVIIVLIILGLSIIQGIQNHSHFDMSIISSILVNPAFILITLIFVVLAMYFKYSSKMEQWYYYSIGSSGSTPPYMSIFTAIVIFDVFVGIRLSNGNGMIESIKGTIDRIKSTLAFYMSPVSSIIFFIIYLLFTTMNMRLASAFFIIYLYFHSFLGMTVYGGGISAGYKEITTSILRALSEDNKECSANGSIEKLVRRGLRFMYDNLVTIIFCTILFSGIFNYNDNMKSGAKNSFIMMNAIILVSIIMFKIIYAFLDKTEYTSSNDYDMPK